MSSVINQPKDSIPVYSSSGPGNMVRDLGKTNTSKHSSNHMQNESVVKGIEEAQVSSSGEEEMRVRSGASETKETYQNLTRIFSKIPETSPQFQFIHCPHLHFSIQYSPI